MASRDPTLIGVALIGAGALALIVARGERTAGPTVEYGSQPVGPLLAGYMTDTNWVELREGPHGDWGTPDTLVKVPTQRPTPVSIVTQGPPRVQNGAAASEKTVAELAPLESALPRYCYERELQLHRGLQGKFVMQFVVTEAGTVTNVEILEDTLHSEQVASCVTRAIRSWAAAARPTSLVTGSYPFEFRPTS